MNFVGDADGQRAARNDHEAGRARQRRDEHEQHAHHDQRCNGNADVLAEVLVRHRAEERGDDVCKRRLEHGALQHGLQRHEQRHAEREHDDGHERACRDRERRDNLVFRSTGLGAGNVARIDRARDLHVDEVAGDEGEVTAARAEHGRVDEKLRHA